MMPTSRPFSNFLVLDLDLSLVRALVVSSDAIDKFHGRVALPKPPSVVNKIVVSKLKLNYKLKGKYIHGSHAKRKIKLIYTRTTDRK